MNPEKCPMCGRLSGDCLSRKTTAGTMLQSSECISMERDRLKAEVERLRREVKDAWDEGWNDANGGPGGDAQWSRSWAKRVSEGRE